METFIFQILSFLFIGVTAYLIKRKQNFISECDQTTGTVVTFRERKRAGKNTTYAPVVEYLALGKTLSHESSLYKAWRKPPVGTTLQIFYKRDKPEDALIDTFSEKWFVAMIFGSLGALFFLIGFGSIISNFL